MFSCDTCSQASLIILQISRTDNNIVFFDDIIGVEALREQSAVRVYVFSDDLTVTQREQICFQSQSVLVFAFAKIEVQRVCYPMCRNIANPRNSAIPHLNIRIKPLCDHFGNDGALVFFKGFDLGLNVGES